MVKFLFSATITIVSIWVPRKELASLGDIDSKMLQVFYKFVVATVLFHDVM